MFKKCDLYNIEVCKEDVDDFIANHLNEDNINFPIYVRGIKFLIKHLRQKNDKTSR